MTDSLAASRYIHLNRGQEEFAGNQYLEFLLLQKVHPSLCFQLQLSSQDWSIQPSLSKQTFPAPIHVEGQLPVAFLKTRAGGPFTVGGFSLRHSGKTHMDFGLFTDLLLPLLLVRKSLSVGCKRHHGGKVEWVTVQPCMSPLSAGSQGTAKSVAAA